MKKAKRACYVRCGSSEAWLDSTPLNAIILFFSMEKEGE
jgi:hypothetical protein